MKAAIGCLIGLVFVVSVSAEPLLEGQVRLESGEPVADAQVRLFDMTDLRQGAIARALTDGTGYFALPLAALTGQALPARFALGPNYPNPFNPSTIIPYQLAASSAVRLEVFNLLGQRITTLVDGERPAGFHTATWHATDGAGRAVGAGVYIYRMMVGAERQTGRMVLLDGQAGVSAGGAASVMPGASGVGGSDGADAQVYGLIVSGSGLVPYVDSAFRVESGMAPVELVVSSGMHSAGKATDDDCAFCDLFGTFNDQQEEEADETEEEEAETDSTSSEGGPDLIVQSPSVSAVMLTPGQEFTLNVTVHNQGDEQAAATMLHYYRSNNATITSSDTEVGTDEIGVLDASATSAASIALTAPTSVSAEEGIYYGACVASVRGESNTDNNCSSAVKITVSGQEAPEDETQEEEADDGQEEEEDETEDEEEESPEEEGADGQVSIPDANLRAAIEDALGKASGAPITVADMAALTRLEAAPNAGIGDLTGLESAANLSWLWLRSNNITDLSPLASLTNLTMLNLQNNSITDISALAGLTNLKELNLAGGTNSITDISALAGLTNLKELNLAGGTNSITDISALAGLTNLERLSLPHGMPDISALAGLTNLTNLIIQSLWDPISKHLTDISALSGLTNLRVLWLGFNSITDISALAGLTNLTNLQLLENNVTDISPMAGLTNLTRLDLGDNNITDVSPLAGLTNLEHLELQINNITDVSPLAGLTNLEHLELQINNITDISALSGLTNLEHLELQTNNIAVIPTMAGLTRLNGLWLGDNNITDISALSGLTRLTDLDLRGNLLSDASIQDHIPALKSGGIGVRFDSFREGDFDIELVFLDHYPEDQKRVVQNAARRWMSIITEDLLDYEFSEGWSGTCGDHSYHIPSGKRIDDLRIYVTTFEGNDPTSASQWGWCGPRALRETERLPVLACLGLNLKRAGDNLFTITLHEIGHGLGFLGWVWDEFGYFQIPPNGDDHFSGPLAIAAFDDAGGWEYPGAKVPATGWGGGHWRYGVLDGELLAILTPESAYKPALSAITVQSMADLGYGVDVTQADPYTLPSAAGKASAKIAASMPSIPGMDVTQADAYTLPGADPHGQGRIAGGLPLLPGDDRLTGRLESTEWIGGRGFDLSDNRLIGRRYRPRERCLSCRVASVSGGSRFT